MQAQLKITDDGKMNVNSFHSLRGAVLKTLATKDCTMFDLVQDVRRGYDEFKYTRPEEFVRVLMDLSSQNMVQSSY